MRYSGDLLLDSDSGYMMPFMPGQDGQVQVRLPFGEQIHPVHGRQFHHVGVDFACVPGSELYALATGTVIGLGTDEVWGEYVICRYGVYQVRYGHLSKVMVTGGQAVRAEMVVGLSGDFLHMDVTCKGREFDPMEFLSMLYSNMQQYAALGGEDVRAEGLDMIVRTDYERDMEEITDMMVQYFPMYMKDVMDKSYIPTERTEVCLRNVFTENASKNYFFEKIPTLGNPLGLSSRAAPLAGKVQNVLIGDFLCYMAVRHGKFVSTWDEGEKKKFLDACVQSGALTDPLQFLDLDLQGFDIPREASVYFDSSGQRCWTKAWFNLRESGEPAQEISRSMAIAFISGAISKDAWLMRFYPRQMTACQKAVEQTRQQLLSL